MCLWRLGILCSVGVGTGMTAAVHSIPVTWDGTGQVPVARDRREDGAGHHLRTRVSEDILHQQLT